MPTALPADPVLLEQAVAEAIRATFLDVPLVATWVNVYSRERFLDSEKEDLQVTTKPDPITRQPITSIMQIGVPSIEEVGYAGQETCSQLNMVYPISFDFSIVDFWDDATLEFNNSSSLVKAIYMRSRKRFKRNADGSTNRDLGYVNCVHDYLQLESAETLDDDDTGGRIHMFDMSLTVHCTSILQ